MRVYLFAILFGLYGASLARADQAADPEPVGEKGIIGADRRQLWSQFTLPGVADQAAMRASLAATQRIRCDGSGGSANLVYRADVILFAAHEIIEDDGAPDKNLDHCMFLVKRKPGDGPPERYPLLLSTLDHGAYAPGVGDARKFEAGNQQDWAVARLARPVEGITPLRLNDEPAAAAPGAAVTEVSDMAENWKGPGRETEHLVESCHVVPIPLYFATAYPDVVHLDCDVGPGASGGALLADLASGAPRYVATIVGYSGSHCARAGLEYCYSVARRLDPELAARVKGTTAIRRSPEDQALGEAQEARLARARDAAAKRVEAELGADFPARDDPPGHEAAELERRAAALAAAGQAADADPLYLAAYKALRDPDQTRPEWPRLLIENGENMRLRGRRLDAAFCFQAAFRIAGDGLRPYLQVKIAQTTNDPKVRRDNLRKAYVAGGEALFHLAGAEAELTEILADGVATAEE